jgi:hypothetical protein
MKLERYLARVLILGVLGIGLGVFAKAEASVTVSATISSTTANVSSVLMLEPRESADYYAAGTATGTVVLERSHNRMTWDNTGIGAITAGAMTPLSGTVRSGDTRTFYRWRADIATGSVTVSLSDNDDFVAEFLNNKGQPILGFWDESIRYSAKNHYLPHGGITSPMIARKTVDQSTNTTTVQDVTELWFPVEANRTYNFEFVTISSAAATTTGVAHALNYPTAATVIAGYTIPTSATATSYGVLTTTSPVIPANSAGTTLVRNTIHGTLVTGSTAGTLQLRFASEVNASEVVIRAGSYGRLW